MLHNILITGPRNVGKTTVILETIKRFNLSTSGFMTFPFESYGVGSTYLMKDLITNQEEPISYYDGVSIKGISQTFSTHGIDCLNHALKNSKDIIVLDELGRFEKNNQEFIKKVNEVFDSEKYVIAVLKAEPIEYIEKIKQRDDCKLLDFSKLTYQEVQRELELFIQREIEKK